MPIEYEHKFETPDGLVIELLVEHDTYSGLTASGTVHYAEQHYHVEVTPPPGFAFPDRADALDEVYVDSRGHLYMRFTVNRRKEKWE